jgi:hypothetical protein
MPKRSSSGGKIIEVFQSNTRRTQRNKKATRKGADQACGDG